MPCFEQVPGDSPTFQDPKFSRKVSTSEFSKHVAGKTFIVENGVVHESTKHLHVATMLQAERLLGVNFFWA